jgi:NAD(P)-dependent dehydrogenase (short-subunit alcohol dehydrogenase family)
MPSIHRPVLILGASRGIGRAAALALAAQGRPVGLGCRTAADAEGVAAEIAAAGGTALPLHVDVTDSAGTAAAAARLCESHGPLGALVNNAGVIDPIGHIADTDPAEWERAIRINLVGAYNGLHAALPRMEGGGVVVNVSSGAAERPSEGWSAYCAAKAGLMMLTRMVHHEYAGRGIRAYGFRPGIVDTDMQVTIRASGMNPVSRIPRGDLLPVDQPAQAIAWLIAEAPDDLSGQEMDIRDAAFRRRIAGD